MKQIKVGVQAMMLKGKFGELGAYETLKRVGELGYRCVEISQIPMTAENVAAMKRAQDDVGWTASSYASACCRLTAWRRLMQRCIFAVWPRSPRANWPTKA